MWWGGKEKDNACELFPATAAVFGVNIRIKALKTVCLLSIPFAFGRNQRF
jgi:hypothetical protein